MPFTLVGSFKPPAGVTDMVGLQAEMRINASALPNWWKHGDGQCRGLTGLATNFDFTQNTACTDFMNGRAVGGFAYDVEYDGPNSARLRLQGAIPIDDRLALNPETEYYAFKVQFLPSRVVDSGACSGCSTPVAIRLREIQLFQPPENAYDPVIVNTLARREAFWQAEIALPDPPVITSFSPQSGKIGDSVEIQGSNLATVTRVRFNEIPAEFEIASDTQLTTRVPDGANDGVIVVEGPGGYASTLVAFDVEILVPPMISSMTPSVGAPGDVVEITGNHFRDVTSVQVGGVEALFEVNSPFSIDLTVPEGALTGRIQVTTTGGFARTADDFIVAPVITAVQPAQGAPGATVSIQGRNLTYVTSLYFGETPATFVIRNANQITTTVPAAATTGRIAVSSPGGTFATPTDFIVITTQAPRIDSFDPTAGAPGRQVIVRGARFVNVASVRLGNHEAPFNVTSPTELRMYVPSGGLTGRISVTTNAGSTLSSADFIVAPMVTEFGPTRGQVSDNVNIQGVNLTHVSRVLFNQSPANFHIVNANHILATVPPAATTGPIEVRNPGGEFRTSTPFVVVDVAPSGGGINLSWDDCGAAGLRTKEFACDANLGAPLTLVGSFKPSAGVTDFLGISSELTIETENALPDWWKHGTGHCRTNLGLSVDLNFTSGPFTCEDAYQGAAAGGFAYDVGFGAPNRARLRVQCAVPIDNRVPLDENTEYYAFKVDLLRPRTTGTGACAGCDLPATITLQSIQLFQPPEKAFDPKLTLPLVGTTAYWQRAPNAVPTIGPNLVRDPSFEGGVGGWRALVTSSLQHVPGGRSGAFAMQATAPDTGGEFGVTDYPNVVKPVLEAGHRYRFGAWVKAESPGLRAQLRVREYLSLVLQQSVNSAWVGPNPEWQYVELDVTATVAGSTLDLAILSPSSTPNAVLRIDDVSIRQLGTAPVMTSSDDLTIDPQQQVVIEMNASDPSGQAIRELEADFSDLPTGHAATFTLDPDKKHGTVTWRPRIEDGGGTYTITFIARSLLEHRVSTRITVRPAANPYGLAINPSFEDQSLYGWTGINGATLTTATPSRSGSYALHVNGSGTFGVNDSPNMISKKRSEALTRYRYTCWVRGVANGGAARLRVREYQDTTRVGTSYSDDITLSTSWRKLIVEHVTGAVNSTLDFAVLCQGAAAMYVDDVSVFGFPTASEAERSAERLSSEIALAPPRVVPNPVRGRAMLEMTLARRGPLKVELYDVNGRRVRRVFENDDAEAGLHQFDIGAGGGRSERLGPGVFFYRIVSAGGVKQGRFVILE